MTYDGIYCSHEGLNGVNSLEEYRAKFSDSGDSNTGLALFDFEALFQDFKIVIIDNEIDSGVVFSKIRYRVDLTKQLTQLKQRLSKLEGLHIPFGDIDNRLEDIWNYLTDKPFNKHRAEMLSQFNIQVTDNYQFDQEAMNNLKASEELRVNTHDHLL